MSAKDETRTPVVVQEGELHVCRTPTQEFHRQHLGERWCFRCVKRVEFTHITDVPQDRMSYYGPSHRIQCPTGHEDGDLFPGRVREWAE